MRVLILGCGPAGLIAAHSAVHAGAKPIILSRAKKSPMLGAQYLHEHIPGTPESRFQIDYQLTGTTDGYRRKVYGATSPVETSPEVFRGKSPAWDIRATYDWLWGEYGDSVEPWEASPSSLVLAINRHQPDAIISTIPAILLCGHEHDFFSTKVWITESAEDIENNTVVCSGMPRHPWYRKSLIQGHGNTEYPIDCDGADVRRMALVTKPLWNNCNCFGMIFKFGRYGSWTKGALSHYVYQDTRKVIER